MTTVLALGAVADVAITKGETPAGDRIWLSSPDGLPFPDAAARRAVAHVAVAHVIADLPHLVVESAFGLGSGLWGSLARGGFPDAAQPGYATAKAAVHAVLNRWANGPDTPDGIRDRMRGHSRQAAALADRLDDETILLAAAGVRGLYRQWRALPPGGALRLTWPLDDAWLRPR